MFFSQATEMAKSDGLLNKQTDKKANRGKSKEQIKEEEEGIIRKVISQFQINQKSNRVYQIEIPS